MTKQISTDITIIGGGIAGLWLLNSLRAKGFNAILLEKHQLGSDQTIASQGMIHGGVKYTLTGNLTGSSEAISEMPDLWRSCIKGEHSVDLRDVKILSDCYYMWTNADLSSRLTGFLGSKALRGRVTGMARDSYPAAFASDQFRGSLYQLGDIVVDVPSLIRCLSKNHADFIYKLDTSTTGHLVMDSDNRIKHIKCSDQLTIISSRYIFAAGAGNSELLQQTGLKTPIMQRRPLHQVLVKHQYPHPLYAHNVDMKSAAKPRLTVTTHSMQSGDLVWNLGGDLAEKGVSIDSETQIRVAKQELGRSLPWIDLQDASWQTFRIDRAEPEQPGLVRPEDAYAKSSGNIIVAWPIKLTLSPHLAESVTKLLSADGVVPHSEIESDPASLPLPRPGIATPLWQDIFQDGGDDSG